MFDKGAEIEFRTKKGARSKHGTVFADRGDTIMVAEVAVVRQRPRRTIS